MKERHWRYSKSLAELKHSNVVRATWTGLGLGCHHTVWPLNIMCGCVFSQTHVQRHTQNFVWGFLFSFLLHYAKLLFWLNCHFPTSHVWEPKGPWVNINETLGPMIMVIASVYVTWVKDTVQPVWEKDILDGRKMDLVPQSHPYSWHNHVQGRWAFVINLRWELPPSSSFWSLTTDEATLLA